MHILCILMQVIQSVYALSLIGLKLRPQIPLNMGQNLLRKSAFYHTSYIHIYTYYKPTLTGSLTGKKIRHLLFTADVFFGFPNPLHKYAFQGKGFPILLNILSHHSVH